MSQTTLQCSPSDEEKGWEATELGGEKGTTLNETPQETDPLVNHDWDSDSTEETSIAVTWIYIIATLVVLILPWIFFGYVKYHGGLQPSHRISQWIIDHPKVNNFIFTAIGTIFNSIISLVSGKAVTNLAKKWIAHNGTDIFGLSFFTGLKNRAIPWQWQYVRLLVTRHLLLVIMMVVYMVISNYVATSSISALITPGPFTRHATLQGKELDFGASSAECDTWFEGYTIENACHWMSYKGGEFTTCLAENQLVDVLESGRSNMLSLQSNASIGLTMPQLGLPFIGPIRGVLPNGPNAIPQFNTLFDVSPFNVSAGTDLTYNYTLQLQGLSGNISCAYMPDTPITYGNLAKDPSRLSLLGYQGTCDHGQNFLDVTYYVVPPAVTGRQGTFGFWACGANGSYTIYLRGFSDYLQSVGNITCTLSPVPAIFPVDYIGRTGLFSSQPHTSTSAGTKSELVSRAIQSLGAIIQEAQSVKGNMFADFVLNFGVKTCGLPQNAKSDKYVQLFGAMIQGVLEYEATYIRLLYEANASAPQSCYRMFDGYVDYQAIGWFVNPTSGYLLIPLTIFNVTALLVLVGTVLIGKEKLSKVDPTSQDTFIFASNRYVPIDPNDPQNWPIKIEHGLTVGRKKGLRFKE